MVEEGTKTKWSMYDEIRERTTEKGELEARIRMLQGKLVRLRRQLYDFPKDVGAMDYTQPKVQTSPYKRAAKEILEEYTTVLNELKYAKAEYQDIDNYLLEVDKIFTRLNDKEKTIYKEKVIYGLNSVQIADKIGKTPPYIGISDRQVRYYLEEIEKKYGI